MPSKPDQNRKDVAAHRERQRQAGIIRIELPIHVDDAKTLRDFAAQLRASRERKASPTP